VIQASKMQLFPTMKALFIENRLTVDYSDVLAFIMTCWTVY